MHLESIPVTSHSFVTDVELWTPRDASTWDRVVLDRHGLRGDAVVARNPSRGANRIALRAIASGRAEVGTDEDRNGTIGVELAIPCFGPMRIESLLVLRCALESARAGCVEIWEPTSLDELSHAEGYYGLLGDFELSSRLAKFRFGSGLPGIAWEKRRPHVIADVRNAPTFLRASLAVAHGLSLGVAIPVIRGADVAQIVTVITSDGTPLAPAVEVWVPDGANRLWLDDSVYAPPFAATQRTMKLTCFMSGEGIVGRAFATQRPVLWSRRQTDARIVDADAKNAGFERIVAIPTTEDGKVRSVLVLRA